LYCPLSHHSSNKKEPDICQAPSILCHYFR